MHIELSQSRRVILNDRFPLWGYRPDKDAFKKIGRNFPDAVIFGFGKYNPYNNTWYVLVYCPRFFGIYPHAATPQHLEAVGINDMANQLQKLQLVKKS